MLFPACTVRVPQGCTFTCWGRLVDLWKGESWVLLPEWAPTKEHSNHLALVW